MHGKPTAARLGPMLLLVSFCALSLEIVLVRSFSIMLWHHLTFMIISIALLGYGASGSLLAIFPVGRGKPARILFNLLLLLPPAILISAWAALRLPFDPVTLLWNPLAFLRLGLLYLLLAVPFANAGLIMSLGYSLHPRKAPLLYLFDLMGGAAGALTGLLLFSATGGRGIPFIALVASSGPLFVPVKTPRRRLLIALLPAAVAIWACLGTRALIPRPNPYKELSQALLYKDARILATAYDAVCRTDLVISPAARGAPGLSLTYRGKEGDFLGVSVDGGALAPIHVGGPRSTDLYRYLPSYFPYAAGRRRNVLLEDCRGGLPLLAALDHGAERIVLAEPYPLALDLLLRTSPEMRKWAGAKEIIRGRGWARSCLARGRGTFDLIEISVTGTVGASSTGLLPAAEEYRLTREALRLYLDRLSDSGILSLTAYLIPPPRTEARIMSTAVEVLEEKTGGQAGRHLLACRSYNTMTLFLKSTPFTPGEIGVFRNFCEGNAFDTIWYEEIRPEEMNRRNVFPEPLYEELLAKLLDREERERLYRQALFDFSPVSDERPFFYNFIRLSSLCPSVKSLGGRFLPILQSGLLLWFILLQAGAAGLAAIILPLAAAFKWPGRGSLPLIAYFSLTGLSYMLLEVAWIQKLSLAAVAPSIAASLVIAVCLFFSGLGSYLSGRLREGYSLRWIFPLIGASGAFSTVLLSLAVERQDLLPGFVPSTAAVIIIAPAALLMGIPFPAGLSRLVRQPERLVPWAWAVNGCLSVMGAVLAPGLASVIGYRYTALLGAVLYACMALSRRILPGQ